MIYDGRMPNAPLINFHGEHAKVPLPLRVLGRYFITGRALRGPGDNATLLHAATVDYRARPYIKLTGPLWQRLARRNGAITVPMLYSMWVFVAWLATLVGLDISAPPLVGLLAYLGALLLAALIWLILRMRRAWRDGRRNREWIDPAAHRLCNILKVRYVRSKARQMISIPRDWGQDREDGTRQSATLYFPEGTVFSKSVKQSITENVGAALGIPSPINADWAENNSRVELFAAPLPPAELKWADIAQAAAECKDDEVVVGRKTGGHLVKVSLSEDAPHIALSGAAGSGKSVLVRVILRQRIERGDGVFIFDPKRFSHMRWANSFAADRVRYAVTDEELHEGWLAVAAEMRRRIALPLDDLAGQRRVWLVAEEINAQIKILTRYWKIRRQQIIRPARALLSDCEKECGGSKQEGLALAEERDPDIMAKLDPPAISPAVVGMQESVFMGRELRMHVMAAAQRLSAGVFGGGGGDVRESFQGGRFMAKWDRKLWKMLADGLPYVAWPGGPRGVWGLARGDEFEIFRAPWLEEKDMANVLDTCVAIYGPVLGQQSGCPVLDSEEVGQLASGVTLANALGQLPGQDGPAAITLDTLRWHAGRPGFPMPLAKEGGYGRTEAKLYDLAELVSWRASVKELDR